MRSVAADYSRALRERHAGAQGAAFLLMAISQLVAALLLLVVRERARPTRRTGRFTRGVPTGTA
jgi:hypothetical protein